MTASLGESSLIKGKKGKQTAKVGERKKRRELSETDPRMPCLSVVIFEIWEVFRRHHAAGQRKQASVGRIIRAVLAVNVRSSSNHSLSRQSDTLFLVDSAAQR